MFLKDVKPRFESRKLFYEKNIKRLLSKNNEIEILLKKITQKNVILDYSQLRIALFHVLRIALPKNSYIATTSYTIYDMLNIIINSNHKPILVDINKNDLSPNIDSLINLVNKKEVKCVIFTYLHGYRVDISKLSDACSKNKCILIEDCAQSLWLSYKEKEFKPPGSYGDIALYSTGFFKNINTISGGFLLIDLNNKIANNLIQSHQNLRNSISIDYINRLFFGLFFKLVTKRILFNLVFFPILKYSRLNRISFINKRAREENNPSYIHRTNKDILKMNILQRSLLSSKSKKFLDEDYKKKEVLAKVYFDELKDLINIGEIEIPGLNPLKSFDSYKAISSFNQIPLLYKERENLLDFLIKNDIDIAEQHIKNLSSYKIYNGYTTVPIVNSEKVSKELLLLPCYPDYKINKVYKLCSLIREFVHSINENH